MSKTYVYLISGEKVIYHDTLNNSKGYAIERMIHDERQDLFYESGIIEIAKEIFQDPPKGYYNDEILKLKEEKLELQKEIEVLKNDLRHLYNELINTCM